MMQVPQDVRQVYELTLACYLEKLELIWSMAPGDDLLEAAA